jgi:hypothetical protein
MGWIGVDLDGTLAVYDGWHSPQHIGKPVGPMVDKVKSWLAAGVTVKIFTARIAVPDAALRKEITEEIEKWCEKHIGVVLEVTNVKDLGMIELWDDRAVRVIANTGIPVLP